MTEFYLSIDVEDWFHSHNLWPALDREKWDEYELRVVENTRRILDLLDEYDTKATFFVLGHVAQRAPELAGEIEDRGHEVASHGYNHELLYEQSETEVRDDLRRAKQLLESQVDQEVVGYRAPSFSITESAIETLSDLGFEYDSSRFPAPVHDRYGDVSVQSSETFTRTESGLTEVQLPLFEWSKVRIPWAGGGYFRFIPYPIFRRGIDRISEHRDFVFYLHPWELDPEQPKVRDVNRFSRLRHYQNLKKTEKRFERLLSAFKWKPISDGL